MHPVELHLAASMIPQEPKLLQTPLTENEERDLGGHQKVDQEGPLPTQAERRTTPLPIDEFCLPPTSESRRSGARFQGEGTQ